MSGVVRLSDKDVDDLTSYADGESRVRLRLNMGSAQLRQLALEAGVEKCPDCGWWAESHEMLPKDGEEPDGHCDNCRINKE